MNKVSVGMLSGKRMKEYKENTKKLLEATKARNVTEAMVKLVFGEDFALPVRLLNTQIEASGREVLELAEAISLIENYNNFVGSEVAKIVKRLHEEGLIMEARFGREGSPVLYIQPPYWEHQASNNGSNHGRRFSDQERREMFIRIREELAKAEPDELGFTRLLEKGCYYEDLPEDPHEVRAWWD